MLPKLHILKSWNTAIAVFLLAVLVESEMSEECRQETQQLLGDSSLSIAQSIIFEDYTASYNQACNFGFADLGCSIKFEGDERTYAALCEGLDGQLYKRPVVLSCAFGTVEYDLGYIPTCVGSSCNTTTFEPNEFNTEQVEAFLDNLTFTGCSADARSGSAAIGSQEHQSVAAIIVVPMALWSGISALFGY